VRVAALYDIHGNLPALESVLRELESVEHDLIVVGGDISAGPMPAETLETLRALGDRAQFVRGNADRELAFGGGSGLSDAWCVAQLSDEQRAFLGGLRQTLTVQVDGLGPTLFCHGSPRSDEDIVTAESPVNRVLPMLKGVMERVVVCGHTHLQFDRTISDVKLVNAGSVGMPYGEPGAHWVLLGPGVDLRRTTYDTAAAAGRIRASGWPRAAEFAAQNVLTVPTAKEAIEFFERIGAVEALGEQVAKPEEPDSS
jgi:putative phosphoesterase